MDIQRALGLLLGVLGLIGQPAATATIKVTFLGTGTPQLSAERYSACILVEAAGQKLLFDAGRGCLIRMHQGRIDATTVTNVFLTHLHSDHVLSLPDLFLTGWTRGREEPLHVWGPRGTRDMMAHVVQAFSFDISARLKNDRRAPSVDAHDVTDGVVFQSGGVTVRAFDVDHGDIAPAFGYRIDVGARSLVLSGDTRFSENLIKASTGVDVLVHEVALGAPGLPPQQQYVLEQHTAPDRAADVFQRVKPRLAVYSHIHLLGGATEAQVMEITRRTYAGRLEMANDLSVAEIGDTITFTPPK